MRHSVWLVPAAEDARSLEQLLERCAKALGSPVFPPHITLCSETAETGLAGADLTLELPITVTLASLGFGSDYFHAAYLLLREDERVLSLQARSASALGGKVSESYPPHLSLAYGVLDDEQRHAAASLVTGLPLQVELDRLELWQTGGAVGDWRRVVALTSGVTR